MPPAGSRCADVPEELRVRALADAPATWLEYKERVEVASRAVVAEAPRSGPAHLRELHRPNLSRRQAKFLRKGLARLGHRSYADYLASPHWQGLRVRYASSGRPKRCAVCHDPAYELHHRTYRRLGEERLDDLVPLCGRHHDELHGSGLPLWDGYRTLRRCERAGVMPRRDGDSPPTAPPSASPRPAEEEPQARDLEAELERLDARIAEWLEREVETLAEALCYGMTVHWLADRDAGWVVPADDGGIYVSTVDTAFDYLLCLHEVAHVAPFPETDAWLELLEERDRDATEGELLVEEESLCWLWAIENASIPVPEQAIARALEFLASYEEKVELEEGPGWRRGPARRALSAVAARTP
jgi:hypothetical protein